MQMEYMEYRKKNNNKKRATASAKYEVQQDNVHTI